jgi:spoIIIJ-associated protein
VDERRHNMDGALFVDDEQADKPRRNERARVERADGARRNDRPGEPRRSADEPRHSDRAGEPRHSDRPDERHRSEHAGEPRHSDRIDEPHSGEHAGEPRDEAPLRARREEDDEKADDARSVTQSILDRMDLDARVTIREDDERVVLDIDGPDAGRAIGKKGMTLEALQFLVNKIVNREPDERRHIVLDSGDYRDRHDSGLVAMAKREAKRAVTSGRAVTLEPMSARDRRVIHVSLAKFPGVSTRSEGEGADRRLQIIPARGSAGGRDREERPRERPRSGGRDARPRSAGRAGSSSQTRGPSEAGLRDRHNVPDTSVRERDDREREREAGERGFDDRSRGDDNRERGGGETEHGYEAERERDYEAERGRDYDDRD